MDARRPPRAGGLVTPSQLLSLRRCRRPFPPPRAFAPGEAGTEQLEVVTPGCTHLSPPGSQAVPGTCSPSWKAPSRDQRQAQGPDEAARPDHRRRGAPESRSSAHRGPRNLGASSVKVQWAPGWPQGLPPTGPLPSWPQAQERGCCSGTEHPTNAKGFGESHTYFWAQPLLPACLAAHPHLAHVSKDQHSRRPTVCLASRRGRATVAGAGAPLTRSDECRLSPGHPPTHTHTSLGDPASAPPPSQPTLGPGSRPAPVSRLHRLVQRGEPSALAAAFTRTEVIRKESLI